MATYYLTPISSIFQFFTNQGIVLSGGKINTYLAGTTTPQQTKTDSTGAVNNANPIILDASGRLPNVQIWQPQGVALKIIVTDSANVQVGPTFDQVTGINDPTGFFAPFASPASGSGADLVANAMRSYDIFSSVRAANTPVFTAGQTLIIDVQGGTAINDGLGGFFYWNSASTAADDGMNVLKLAAAATGRFIRLGYNLPNAMYSYDIFSSVRAAAAPVMATGQTLIIDTEGATAVGDNLGGLFYWSASSVAADDGANVLKPNSVAGAGRYLRLNNPVAAASVPVGAITQYYTQTLSATPPATGHTKFPNGLILQWGSIHIGDVIAPPTGTLTFNIAFPTACLHVMISGSDALIPTDATFVCIASTYTTTNFVYAAREVASPGPTQDATLHYLAVGF